MKFPAKKSNKTIKEILEEVFDDNLKLTKTRNRNNLVRNVWENYGDIPVETILRKARELAKTRN